MAGFAFAFLGQKGMLKYSVLVMLDNLTQVEAHFHPWTPILKSYCWFSVGRPPYCLRIYDSCVLNQ